MFSSNFTTSGGTKTPLIDAVFNGGLGVVDVVVVAVDAVGAVDVKSSIWSSNVVVIEVDPSDDASWHITLQLKPSKSNNPKW